MDIVVKEKYHDGGAGRQRGAADTMTMSRIGAWRPCVRAQGDKGIGGRCGLRHACMHALARKRQC